MQKRADKIVVPNGSGGGLNFRELLIIAALFGGCDAQTAIHEAEQVLNHLDGKTRTLPKVRVVKGE